jgi:enoyl-CoA hydratase/carnithine racemase
MTEDLANGHVKRIQRSIDGGDEIALAMDRPDKLNALPAASIETLIDQVEDIEQSDGDVVTITGRGGNFCVGADLDEMDTIDADEAVETANRLHRLVDAMRNCPLPILTAVQGRAYGVGFIICMASDIIVAGDGADFGLQEVKLGIPVGGYSTALLPAIVGETRARQWMLTGSTVPATDAATAGFVTQVVPSEDVMDVTASLANRLASNSSTVIGLLKSQLANSGNGRELAEIRENEAEAIRTAFLEGDATERIREFHSTD